MTRITRFAGIVLLLCLALPSSGAKHENWVEVRSPNFVVVCNAGEKQARKTALQFEQIRAVFRQSFKFASEHPSPLITVLAVKDEESMHELMPEYWTKGHIHPGGLFASRMNVYFAAVNLDAHGDNPYEIFYHEYYHSVTMPYFPNLPLWLAEGLAEFYGHTQIDEKSVGMGQADAAILQELRSQPFMPLMVLFKTDRSSPYYNEANKTSIFYAESWALTHYLMLGDRGTHRAMLIAYLNALANGKTQDEAAVQAFGDVKKLQSDLQSYIARSAFYFMKTAAPAKITDADLKSRPISEAEAEAYRGGFTMVRGRLQESEEILDGALKLDANLALAHEYLAIAEFYDGQREKALESMSKSVELDPKNSFTHYMRAYLTHATGNRSHAASAEDDLRQAVALSPEFAPPYGLLAVYMAMNGENLPDALSLAQKGVSLEPANSTYQLALAQVLARMEKYDDAKLAASRAQAWAIQPQDRANAQSFLNFLEQTREIQGSIAARNASNAAPPSDSTDSSDMALDEGTVASESCEGGLKVDLETDDGTLHLRAAPNRDFPILIQGKPIPTFDRCTSLKGLRVSIRYLPDDDDEDSGTIRSLTVLASDEASTLSAGMAIANGKVTSVTCKNNEMQLTLALADAGKSLVLHANDYTKINFLAGAMSSVGDLEPCSEMKGRNVKITYAEAQQKQFAGEMQTIVVGK